MPSDGGLIGVLGVFYSSENRRIIACLNAMGKIVFNDNQRWVELNYKPQHLPSRLKKMDNGNGDAVSERRKRKKSKEKSSTGKDQTEKPHKKKVDKEEYSGDEKRSLKFLSMPAATLTSKAHDNAPTMIFSLSTDGTLYGIVQKKKGEWIFESHDCFEDAKTDSAFVEDDFEEEVRSNKDLQGDYHDGETVHERGSDKPSVAPSNVDAHDEQDNGKQSRVRVRFVSAPSKAILRGTSLSIFLVSDDGKLYERTIDLQARERWRWVVHDHPHGYLLSPAAPLVSHAGEIVCRTREGCLQRFICGAMSGNGK